MRNMSTLEELMNNCPKGHTAIFVPEAHIIFYYDREGHTQRIFGRVDGVYQEIDMDFRSMSKKIAEGIKTEELVEDVLRTLPVQNLIKAKAILMDEKAKVRSKPGCYGIVLNGAKQQLTIDFRGG